MTAPLQISTKKRKYADTSEHTYIHYRQTDYFINPFGGSTNEISTQNTLFALVFAVYAIKKHGQIVYNAVLMLD